jgi:hypothetical protein
MKSTVWILGVGVMLVATVAFASLNPRSSSMNHDVQQTMKHAAVDQGHEMFQPAYLDNRLVQFTNLGAAPKGIPANKIRTIYETEYPTGWQELLARPLCDYCDHFGDGENAWDYHDHILDGLPSQADNDAKTVYWNVIHIHPAYTKDAAKDAQISQAYAALLPAQSVSAVKKLLAAKLSDGSLIATPMDLKYVFTAPLTRK